MHLFPRACLRLRPRLPTFGPCRGRAEAEGHPVPKTLMHALHGVGRGRSVFRRTFLGRSAIHLGHGPGRSRRAVHGGDVIEPPLGQRLGRVGIV